MQLPIIICGVLSFYKMPSMLNYATIIPFLQGEDSKPCVYLGVVCVCVHLGVVCVCVCMCAPGYFEQAPLEYGNFTDTEEKAKCPLRKRSALCI